MLPDMLWLVGPKARRQTPYRSAQDRDNLPLERDPVQMRADLDRIARAFDKP